MRSYYFFNNRLVSHIIFWIFVLLFYTYFQAFYAGHFFHILKTNLFYLPQDIVSVYVVLYVLFPKYLLKFKVLAFIILSIITILVLTLFSVLVTYYLLPALGLYTPPISIDEQFSNTIFALTGITGMAATLKYIRLNMVNQFKANEISMKQMESELKYLRSQINPHFLFNSLNNIDELIYQDRKRASKAIFLLSEILRYVLKESESKKVPLFKELEFIERYIEFVRFSFKENNFIAYTVENNLEGNQAHQEIPPLLFLPVIENAVKYANRKAKSLGIIIHISINADCIEFDAINQISKSALPLDNSGIGLKNLRRRLELIYPGNYTLDTVNDEHKYKVKLKINRE